MQEIIADKKSEPKNRKVSAGSTFNLEKQLLEQGYDFVIGTDEVGRGPLCGPVVACAVTLRDATLQSGSVHPHLSRVRDILSLEGEEAQRWSLVRDSKKLSEKQREEIFDFIHEHFYVGIGLCDHETIDRINILEASFLSMKKAVASLERAISNDQFPISNKIPNHNDKNLKNTKYIILVDGNKTIPNFSHEQKAIIGGDRVVKSISAASIVAKVTRDRMMMDMHKKYPQYGMDKHKGYGTKLHMDALTQHGPCEIHRKSFAPVKKALMRAGLYKSVE